VKSRGFHTSEARTQDGKENPRQHSTARVGGRLPEQVNSGEAEFALRASPSPTRRPENPSPPAAVARSKTSRGKPGSGAA
jgi:hypothetical protein